jgi:hypothetical protein
MVDTEKHLVFLFVNKLIELALSVQVSTTTVERAFSCLKTIKSKSRNKIADDWFSHLMVCYIEQELFNSFDVAIILSFFDDFKT